MSKMGDEYNKRLEKYAPELYHALKGMAECSRNIELKDGCVGDFEEYMLEICIGAMDKVIAKVERNVV